MEDRSALVCEPRQFGDRLDRADLVVGVHHADDRGVVCERLPQCIGGDNARLVDLEERRAGPALAQGFDRVEDRLVLDVTGHEVMTSAAPERLGDAADGEIVTLGPAAGEDDFGRVGADQGCHGAPGLVDSRFRLLSEVVDARRVAPLVAQRRAHPVGDRRGERGRGVVIQVDALHGPKIVAPGAKSQP